MRAAYRLIKIYAWTFWLGASLAHAGVHAPDVAFWIIFVPTAILVEVARNTK